MRGRQRGPDPRPPDAATGRGSGTAHRRRGRSRRSRRSSSIPPTPGDHNQAMMELGRDRVPAGGGPPAPPARCGGSAPAAAAGDPEAFPRLEPKRTERRSVVRVWCERAGALLLHRNASRRAPAGGPPRAPHAHARRASTRRASPRGRSSRGKIRGITRFRIAESIHSARRPRGEAGPGPGLGPPRGPGLDRPLRAPPPVDGADTLRREGPGPGPGRGRAPAGARPHIRMIIASASISTSISGEMSRLTSTMLVAGLISLKTSPWARPTCSQWEMSTT